MKRREQNWLIFYVVISEVIERVFVFSLQCDIFVCFFYWFCCCAPVSHNFANWNENKIQATNRTLIISTWIRHISPPFRWMQCTIKWIWLFDTVHEARQMLIFGYPFIFSTHTHTPHRCTALNTIWNDTFLTIDNHTDKYLRSFFASVFD